MTGRMDKHVAIISQKYALQFDTLSAWHAHNFQISQNSIDSFRILDSYHSTPSRYVEEMASRIMRMTLGTNVALLLFNPYLSLDEYEFRTVVSHADRLARLRRTVIFTAKNGIPVAYYFAEDTCDSSRYLLLLSCVNAAVDAKLLQAAYFVPCDVIKLPLAGYTPPNRLNGFLGRAYAGPMVWCAEAGAAAINAVTGITPTPLAEISEMRAARNRLGFYAYDPYHAGDVLFMAIASQRVDSLFDSVVVHESYAGIARRAGCNLPILVIDGPVCGRGGHHTNETKYFQEVASALPADRLYVYCRATRNYNITDFHLIDHIGFALGGRYLSGKDLYHQKDTRMPVAEVELDIRDRPPRVLLHFDAGWPLKIYPLAMQGELVSEFLAQGCEVTILDGKNFFEGCKAVKFESLDALEHVMAEHDIVVGMDSFPAHFSSLVLNMPTICLFSSTHPINSCSSMSSNYVWLSNSLNCAPCQKTEHCDRYGGTECRNFSPPSAVANIIDKFLKSHKVSPSEESLPQGNENGLPNATFRHLPSEKVPQFLHGNGVITSVFIEDGAEPTLLAVMGYAIRTSFIFRLPLYVYRLSLIIKKYLNIIRHNGFRAANKRARDYFEHLRHLL